MNNGYPIYSLATFSIEKPISYLTGLILDICDDNLLLSSIFEISSFALNSFIIICGSFLAKRLYKTVSKVGSNLTPYLLNLPVIYLTLG